MKKKGFTLLEVLIATSIFLIFVIAASAVMDVGRSAWFTGDVAVELRQEINKAFMYMEKDLEKTRPAEISLASDSSSTSLTFKIPQDNDADGTILDSNGNIEWSGDSCR